MQKISGLRFWCLVRYASDSIARPPNYIAYSPHHVALIKAKCTMKLYRQVLNERSPVRKLCRSLILSLQIYRHTYKQVNIHTWICVEFYITYLYSCFVRHVVIQVSMSVIRPIHSSNPFRFSLFQSWFTMLENHHEAILSGADQSDLFRSRVSPELRLW